MRESVYREQLARVLEDARVKNAMLLEAQRQVKEFSLPPSIKFNIDFYSCCYVY